MADSPMPAAALPLAAAAVIVVVIVIVVALGLRRAEREARRDSFAVCPFGTEAVGGVCATPCPAGYSRVDAATCINEITHELLRAPVYPAAEAWPQSYGDLPIYTSYASYPVWGGWGGWGGWGRRWGGRWPGRGWHGGGGRGWHGGGGRGGRGGGGHGRR